MMADYKETATSCRCSIVTCTELIDYGCLKGANLPKFTPPEFCVIVILSSGSDHVQFNCTYKRQQSKFLSYLAIVTLCINILYCCTVTIEYNK